MFYRLSVQRRISFFFLLVFLADMVLPLTSYAITSGPAQPEMKQFQPADSGELVDPFTGDFKYNIPLGELDGYPLNLAYQTGSGPEDEASWVGLGWNFNPGSLTRSVRGLPDDFDGSKGDVIKREFNRKEYKKVGAQLTVKATFFGFEAGSAAMKIDFYKDNYFGIGASVGADLQYNLGASGRSAQTAGLGLSVNSDVRDGVSLSPSFGVENKFVTESDELMMKGGLSGGFLYNTRGGLASTTLGASFDVGKNASLNRAILGSNGVNYFGQTYTPKIQHNTSSLAYSFSGDAGLTLFGGYLGGGSVGYRYTEKILDKIVSKPAFGYLHYEKGRRQKDVLLDFNREKDGVFLLSNPAIPTPIQTYDLYTVATHAGSYQFRPYYNGNYTVFDNKSANQGHNVSAGGTVGFGNLFQAGGRLAYTNSNTTSGKWEKDNNFLTAAENVSSIQYDDELISFRPTGDLTDRKINNSYLTANWGSNVQKITLGNSSTGAAWKNKNNVTYGFSGPLVKQNRDYRKTVFSYLTNEQAEKHGLNREQLMALSESDTYRKDHHIGEVTITQEDGSRMVFGLPVYNIEQAEVAFSKGPEDPEHAYSTKLLEYTATDASMQNTNLRDHYYSKDFTPAYTTSHLLTGVLSPDYNDLTGDGITEDDLGVAVKFDYTRHTKEYKWRTPFAQNIANYNEGFQSDPKDDKGNYVYGKKEVWYLQKIESRTMIAIMQTSDRLDGYGVAGEHGGIGPTALKKLDKIIIYRKADYFKNQQNAIPVKTIHFTYDYALHKGIPNHANHGSGQSATGKLTLRKVHFTYGKNTRGSLNPYEFSYDERLIQDGDFPNSTEPALLYDYYEHRNSDRWGTFKQGLFNKPEMIANTREYYEAVSNSVFPYSIQKNDLVEIMDYDERELSNRFASKWLLNKIHTPTGSEISVEYEADDYSFVQNRRAMQMCFINGTSGNGVYDGLINTNKLTIQLPMFLTGGSAADKWDRFKDAYLMQEDGKLMEYLFYKVMVDLNNEMKNEYVNGYAKIDYASAENAVSENGDYVTIALKPVEGVNPISFAGWQLLKTSLPQFAYDNFDNSDVENDNLAAIKSLVASIKGLGELTRPFSKMAKAKKFCDQITGVSMVRLMNPGIVNKAYAKIGGGSRVRKIILDDRWQPMLESVEGQSLTGVSTKTGKLYEYITTKGGLEISSGVASYEPSIGNEENPFREPVPFVEKVHLGQDKYHFIEQPFCEAYFPAPVVGYSKIRITSLSHTDIVSTGGALLKETGWVEQDFYTAKDFPTLVEYIPIETKKFKTTKLLEIFASTAITKIGVTQGFLVELNDMHGKPKGMSAFNKSGAEISYTKYFYNEADPKDNLKKLNSEVEVVDPNGQVRTGLLGEDLDMTSDHRESNSLTRGTGAGIYFGGFYFGLGGSPFSGFNPSYHHSEQDFRSVSTVKCIQRYGILKRVETMDNGSIMNAENMLFDAQTGGVVLTKTTNEFKDPIYSFNYPAYWAYKNMGHADRNNGVIIEVPANGNLSGFASVLIPGDELVSTSSDKKGWVILNGDNILRLVDENGAYVATTEKFKLIRSGRRNILTESVGAVVMLENPRKGNNIIINQSNKILNTSVKIFKDEWRMAIPELKKTEIRTSVCNPALNCFEEFLKGMISEKVDGRRAFFVNQSDNLTAVYITGNNAIKSECNEPFFNDGFMPDEMPIYQEFDRRDPFSNMDIIDVGDRLRIGNFYLVVESFAFDFYMLVNSNITREAMNVELDSYVNNYKKYCLIPLGNCSYALRRTESCTVSAPTQTTECLTSSNCSYTNLLTFHLEPIPYEFEYCENPVAGSINPYVQGILGNWRPWMDYVYHVNRIQTEPGQTGQNASDLRKSGYFSTFSPFWTFSSNGIVGASGNYPLISNPTDSRWVWTSQALQYDRKGNLVESVQPTAQYYTQFDAGYGVDNPLGTYSSALYGYGNSQAVGIASNARRNEIMFDGFEDYDFSLREESSGLNCGLLRHFDWGLQKTEIGWSSAGANIVSGIAHSGKHSLEMIGPTVISREDGNEFPGYPILSYFQDYTYALAANEPRKGFAPVFSKNYLFSCWISEGGGTNTNTIDQLSISINGESINLANKVVPVVEGWKKLEVSFTAAAGFTLELNASSTIYLDDVRIHPVDAQMQTFVYDPIFMRLNAQLDENNFAQFYEYDESGTPVRIKRETEKGIVTVKENRQYIRAHQ